MLAVYVRTSTDKQKNDSQVNEINLWLKAQGHDETKVRWYQDQQSGKSLDRKDFHRLEADIFKGEIKTVVVWKLDRLSRNLRDGINLVTQWCEKGIRLVSITQQLDLSGVIGKLVATLLFGIAEMEREHILERQAAGIKVARKKGKYKGRQEGTVKAKPERAKALREKGMQPSEIATALGTCERTIWRYLKYTSNDISGIKEKKRRWEEAKA